MFIEFLTVGCGLTRTVTTKVTNKDVTVFVDCGLMFLWDVRINVRVTLRALPPELRVRSAVGFAGYRLSSTTWAVGKVSHNWCG